MKLIVNPHTTTLDKTPVNEKEINITKVEFEFKDIPNEYVKKAFFTLDGNSYAVLIENNECNIPYEVLNKKGQVELGVIAYELDNDEYVARYNPSPCYFTSMVGSLKEKYENTEPVTPTDKEQMEQALQSGLNDIQEAITQANNLDIDVEKTGNTARITITKQDETQETVNIYDGTDGQDGVSLEYNWNGTSLGIKREDEQNYDYVNLKGDTGEPGAISLLIVNVLPETGEEGTLYFVPKQDSETGDIYDEYMWVNNAWELLGEKQITVDLSDYYTKEQTNALIPTSLSELTDDTTHRLVTDTEKSTWDGKVSPTDYAQTDKGGTIKVSSTYNIGMNNGNLVASNRTYANYQSDSNYSFIGKGTLDNVLNAVIGDIDSALDTLNGEVVS